MTHQENQAVETFQKIEKGLGVKVVSPFLLKVGSNQHECLAFFPQFGGDKGTLVKGTMPPEFKTDKQFVSDAESENYRWSFVNVDDYLTYDEELIKECLMDWGFSGLEGDRPTWL